MLRALPLCLLSWLLLLCGCTQRSAAAQGHPVVAVPQNPPLQEPPPAGGAGLVSIAMLLPSHAPDVEPPPATSAAETGDRPCGKDRPSGMSCIQGGPFLRGANDGNRDERPPMRVTVSPFFMDVYEVDNEHYNRCVKLGKCDPPVKFYARFSKPRQPVVAVSWFHADTYCRFVGKRLPTEAEWEKAARGPDGDMYPWGNEPPTCERAVFKQDESEQTGCGTDITANVGSRPVGRYGLYDMAGNSWEWVEDWYSECYAGCKRECGAACTGPDPRGPCGGGDLHCPGFHQKTLKGGSWYWPAGRTRGSERRGVSPANRGPHRLGFRCAQSISQSTR